MMDERRRIQRRQESSTLLSTIGRPLDTATPLGTAIVSATPAVNSPKPLTSSTISTTSTTPSASTTNGTPTATSTSSAATSKSGDNSNILIPAIVAPVASVLVISFIVFWLVMRRRTKKALAQEPEFVMEGMKEKPRDRPATPDSNSSTQELVPTKHKEAAIDIKELDQFALPTSVTAGNTTFMPLPQPPAPLNLGLASDSRPGSRQADSSGQSKAIPNFSRGPRANGGSRDVTPTFPTGLSQRQRDESRVVQYPPASGAQSMPRHNMGLYGQEQNNQAARSVGQPLQPRQGSFSRPLGPLPATGMKRGPPAPIATGAPRPSQDDKSYRSQAGAYNGASPISQYSPIVKEMPKLGLLPTATLPDAQLRTVGGALSSTNDQGTRKPPPPAIITGNSPLTPSSPAFANGTSRNVQPAGNTRLNFHSIVTNTTAASPATEEPPTPSPRLPPPATRDAPPTNYNIPLPAHEPPAPTSIQARLNGASISDRRSVVSGLSDDYVDMEVDDAKSDVSSLDEREKWQMQSDSERANSRQARLGGYGGLGPRPPLLNLENSSNHNSDDGSQYSLGYYSKDINGLDKR